MVVEAQVPLPFFENAAAIVGIGMNSITAARVRVETLGGDSMSSWLDQTNQPAQTQAPRNYCHEDHGERGDQDEMAARHIHR